MSKDMSKVQLAISPLTWSNDDMPSLGGETPLETCLAGMHEAGFKGSEMGVKYPRTTEELKPKLEENGLVLASGWYSLELCHRSVEAEIEAVQNHLALMKGCGCKVMVAGEVSNTARIFHKRAVAARQTFQFLPFPWNCRTVSHERGIVSLIGF